MLQNHHISSGVNVLETRRQDKLRPDIEPFPTHFVQCWTLKNGIPVTVRTLSGSDEPLITRFHQQLSARSIYLRYFGLPTLAQRVTLTLSCLTDDRELALVAVTRSECDSGQEVVGVAQMSMQRGVNAVECALVVADAYQNQGLGRCLCDCLFEISRAAGAQRIISMILPENYTMRVLGKRLGCNLGFVTEDRALWVTLHL